MEKRTAAVFGSTGLIGNLLLEELVLSEKYSLIKSFVRRPTGVTEQKVEEVVSDLTDLLSLSDSIVADDLFVCLGTTIKKAGSVSNMEKIDRDLPVGIAEKAFANGVKNIAVVSSIGASAKSANYYLRIKGEMEDRIMMIGFRSISIVRPSLLLGDRNEKRAGEKVSKVVMTVIGPLMAGSLKKYRAIHGGDVARAMISLVLEGNGKRIIESDELQVIADKYGMN
ncbi:MAG TPA: NAD(P)H-binding protein [Bacteroidales bacterium]|nr:NAD(P)H-binding protein [Bacteroidales bacterium]